MEEDERKTLRFWVTVWAKIKRNAVWVRGKPWDFGLGLSKNQKKWRWPEQGLQREDGRSLGLWRCGECGVVGLWRMAGGWLWVCGGGAVQWVGLVCFRRKRRSERREEEIEKWIIKKREREKWIQKWIVFRKLKNRCFVVRWNEKHDVKIDKIIF